jgi:hypothetical protein
MATQLRPPAPPPATKVSRVDPFIDRYRHDGLHHMFGRKLHHRRCGRLKRKMQRCGNLLQDAYIGSIWLPHSCVPPYSGSPLSHAAP